MSVVPFDDVRVRAAFSLSRTLCQIRMLSRYPASPDSQNLIFRLADAAHEIPMLLCAENGVHSTSMHEALVALDFLLERNAAS